MKTRDSNKNKLNEILEVYESAHQSDPVKLRLSIPSSEMWRFFIDEYHQENGRGLKEIKLRSSEARLTIAEIAEESPGILTALERRSWALNPEQASLYTFNDLLLLDRAWIPYEHNESGYLQALFKAFDLLFYQKIIDIEFIQKLHVIATGGVNLKRYHAGGKGQFRDEDRPVVFRLVQSNSTQKGIDEFLKRNNENVRIQFSSDDDDWFNLMVYSSEKKSMDKDSHAVSKLVYKRIKNNYGAYFRLYSMAEQDYPSESSIDETVNEILKKFEWHMARAHKRKAQLSIKKLRIIIKCVQSLEQLHPFRDANCRTLCMLFLNFLLMRSGFPFALLSDANQFDMYSIDELILRVLDGMHSTLRLSQRKLVFKVRTDDVISDLEVREYLNDKIVYFNECVAIENNNRKKLRAMQDKVSDVTMFKSSAPSQTEPSVWTQSCCML